MLYLSNGRYQWAGEPDTNAILPPMCDARSAYTVAVTTDWGAIGWEIIYNPTKAQIKEGDIFTISPEKSGIWSGHTGIVYSNNSNGITTLEQNYNGNRFVQKILTGNSYYTFGGFMCIVRPKENKPPQPTPQEKEEENMFVVQTKENNYVVTSDGFYTWIPDLATLKAWQAKLPTITMDDGKMRGMFVNVSVKKAIPQMQKDIAEILKRQK